MLFAAICFAHGIRLQPVWIVLLEKYYDIWFVLRSQFLKQMQVFFFLFYYVDTVFIEAYLWIHFKKKISDHFISKELQE